VKRWFISEARESASVARYRAARLALVAAAAALAVCGCRTGYVARLAYEEARYLASARPIEQLLAETEDPQRAQALALVLEVRSFAAGRGLDPGSSYLEVVDTGSASPFQVVTAAPVDRLEPYTWWYPVIGAIPYRGYFDRDQAAAYAAALRADGLDTRIVEASAYSTLGWFADPLPSNVLDRGPLAIATTVFHELVHQNFFAPGQVAFNETLATAVAYRLTADFFDGRGDVANADRVRRSRTAWLARGRVLDTGAVTLDALFARARSDSWPRDRLLAEREAAYRGIRDAVAAEDAAFAAVLADGGLDNASFLAVYRYAERAAVIDDFLARQQGLPTALARLRVLTRHGQDGYAALARGT